MARTVLINPKRRKARRNPSPAQRANQRRFAAAARARSNPAKRRARRRNPAPIISYTTNPRRRARRRNPVGAYVARRRRRNPISLGGGRLSVNSILSLAKDGAIMGAGAVAMDFLYAQVSKYLPANMQAGPGQLNLGSAVKMGITAALGIALNRATKGISRKAAVGALTVQARDIVLTFVPASVSSSVAGLSYASPARVMNRDLRIGSNVGAYYRGQSPLMNGVGAYIPGMRSPVLSGGRLAGMFRT